MCRHNNKAKIPLDLELTPKQGRARMKNRSAKGRSLMGEGGERRKQRR
jgi:hypothetical protein